MGSRIGALLDRIRVRMGSHLGHYGMGMDGMVFPPFPPTPLKGTSHSPDGGTEWGPEWGPLLGPVWDRIRARKGANWLNPEMSRFLIPGIP